MNLTEEFLKSNGFTLYHHHVGSDLFYIEDKNRHIDVQLFMDHAPGNMIHIRNNKSKKEIDFSHYPDLTIDDFRNCLKFMDINDDFAYN